MRISEHKSSLIERAIIYFGIYILFKVIMDVLYVVYVYPIYGYSGFELEFNILTILVSYVYTIILILILPKGEKRVSYMILQLHFIVIFVPVSTIYAFSNLSFNFFTMIFCCFLIQFIMLKKIPLIRFTKLKIMKRIFYICLVICTVVVYLYAVRTQQWNFGAFDITNIYKIRENIEVSTLMGYLISWQYVVINPILLLYGFKNKKLKIVMFVFLIQVALYLMLPYKTIILSFVLILLAYFICLKKYKFGIFFTMIISGVSIVFGLIYTIFNIVAPFSVFPVRFLYVPALIKFQHYNFFSEHQKLFYSEGMLGKILNIKYPYDVPSGFLVASPTSNDNTGFIAYAYDNLGLLGMLLITILFILILWIIDSLVVNYKKKEVFILLIYPMIILNDGDLLTLLLTGGFLIIMVAFFTNVKLFNYEEDLNNSQDKVHL